MTIKLRSNISAGLLPTYATFRDFVSTYAVNIINDETYPFLQTVLEDTVEACKQNSKSGRKCDEWGDAFLMPFGHG